MSWARNDTVAVIEVGWNWSRTVDKAAVAERIVAQVTVWIHPVILRRWRELGCGISSAACVVSRTRTIVVRTVDIAVVRAVVVRAVVVRTVDIAVVRAVVVRAVDVAVVRAVVVRTVDIAIVRAVVVRTVDVAVVRAVVVRTVDVAVVRAIVVRAVVSSDSAFCADIAHVVVIVSAGIYSRRVAATLSCLTVCRTG